MATNETCLGCGAALGPEALRHRDRQGNVYCVPCAIELPACETCGAPVTESEDCYRDVEGVTWHKECD